jgi:hypothetical protein
VFFEVNRTPQHQVGRETGRNWGEDPLWEAAGIHYFDALTRFYIDSQGGGWRNKTCRVAQFEFARADGEPDDEVSSISATYNGSAYEIVFSGPKNSTLKYEIWYSRVSMREHGLGAGNRGKPVSANGSGYTAILWKSPKIPEVDSLYVAIRPKNRPNFTELVITRGPAGAGK